jgi:hypothetical protein
VWRKPTLIISAASEHRFGDGVNSTSLAQTSLGPNTARRPISCEITTRELALYFSEIVDGEIGAGYGGFHRLKKSELTKQEKFARFLDMMAAVSY